MWMCSAAAGTPEQSALVRSELLLTQRLSELSHELSDASLQQVGQQGPAEQSINDCALYLLLLLLLQGYIDHTIMCSEQASFTLSYLVVPVMVLPFESCLNQCHNTAVHHSQLRSPWLDTSIMWGDSLTSAK